MKVKVKVKVKVKEEECTVASRPIFVMCITKKWVSCGSRGTKSLVPRPAQHVRQSRGCWCAATVIVVSWIVYHVH